MDFVDAAPAPALTPSLVEQLMEIIELQAGQASEPYHHWSYAWRVATGQESALAGVEAAVARLGGVERPRICQRFLAVGDPRAAGWRHRLGPSVPLCIENMCSVGSSTIRDQRGDPDDCGFAAAPALPAPRTLFNTAWPCWSTSRVNSCWAYPKTRAQARICADVSSALRPGTN